VEPLVGGDQDGMTLIDGRLQIHYFPIFQSMPLEHSHDAADRSAFISRAEFVFDRLRSAALAEILQDGVDRFSAARISIQLYRTWEVRKDYSVGISGLLVSKLQVPYLSPATKSFITPITK